MVQNNPSFSSKIHRLFSPSSSVSRSSENEREAELEFIIFPSSRVIAFGFTCNFMQPTLPVHFQDASLRISEHVLPRCNKISVAINQEWVSQWQLASQREWIFASNVNILFLVFLFIAGLQFSTNQILRSVMLFYFL